jgi:hypothetical protein
LLYTASIYDLPTEKLVVDASPNPKLPKLQLFSTVDIWE